MSIKHDEALAQIAKIVFLELEHKSHKMLAKERRNMNRIARILEEAGIGYDKRGTENDE